MDYFGLPHTHTYMLPETPFIDIPALRAAIPGSGNERVAWTHTTDVARFVRRLVEVEEGTWEAKSVIVGDTVALNEILRWGEEVRG